MHSLHISLEVVNSSWFTPIRDSASVLRHNLYCPKGTDLSEMGQIDRSDGHFGAIDRSPLPKTVVKIGKTRSTSAPISPDSLSSYEFSLTTAIPRRDEA